MPYLNWKDETALTQEVGSMGSGDASSESADAAEPGQGRPLRMSLGLMQSHVEALLPLLRDTLLEGGELRVDLPRGWIVFWKRRDGESRLLLAHPQEDEWVATAALSPSHAQSLISRLENWGAGGALHLSELEPVGSMSNLELTLANLG